MTTYTTIIHSASSAFRDYLKLIALTPRAYRFVESIASQTDTYIFSGLILDCIAANELGMTKIDLIAKDLDTITLPPRYRATIYTSGIMDVINENIPNPDLAIISTLYYGLAYDFRIRCNLSLRDLPELDKDHRPTRRD